MYICATLIFPGIGSDQLVSTGPCLLVIVSDEVKTSHTFHLKWLFTSHSKELFQESQNVHQSRVVVVVKQAG